jgi:hypothetical protein
VNEAMGTTSEQMALDDIIQTTKISGKTATKVLNGIIMGEQGFPNEKVCQQFAKDTHDDDLFNAMAESLSNLSVGGEAKLLARNNVVFNGCTDNLTAMVAGGYLITAAKVALHGTYISNYRTSVPSWKTADGLIVTATKRQVVSNSSIVQDLIPDMKRFLLPYKAAHLGFYDAMINAMKPVSVGTRKNNLRVLIVDADTLLPIGGVTGTLTINMRNIVKHSSKKFYLTYSSTGNGNGVLGVVKPGYTPVTTRGIAIDATKLLKMTIKMTLLPSAESLAEEKKKKAEEKKGATKKPGGKKE